MILLFVMMLGLDYCSVFVFFSGCFTSRSPQIAIRIYSFLTILPAPFIHFLARRDGLYFFPFTLLLSFGLMVSSPG